MSDREAQSMKKDMNQGNLSLTEVALNAGYFDQSHFNHEFLGGFGETPRAYVEKHEKLIWNRLVSS